MAFGWIRREYPLVLALVCVGGALGTLLVGYEPIGGDPDRMYRPLKSELATALSDGRLPFWSTRFGLGFPLVAESHVAAFYPPNLIVYRLLELPLAYRLSMWLHYLALVASTYAYARTLNIDPWGGGIAAITFSLCGFQAIHSSHEPFYMLMPYLPLSLALAERFLMSGQFRWLPALALALGIQWTLGHFQVQTWTGSLVILSGFWRVAIERRKAWRVFGLGAAVAWGLAVAAVQLGLTWELAQFVHQTTRKVSELSYYSYPPSHWFELALPRLLQMVRLGPEDPYWYGQQTTGYEAVLYVGTIPLILAVIGVVGKPASKAAALWRLIVLVSFALATMPRWWPRGYEYVLSVPVLGYFRVPGRYTLLTSLGLSILAGEGFGLAGGRKRFALGLTLALAFGAAAALRSFAWAARSDVRLVDGYFGGGGIDGWIWSAVAWGVAVIVILGWRYRKLSPMVVLAVVTIELALLYYHGTTEWGWSIELPRRSPILTRLASMPGTRLVGGELSNVPIRADLATATPYLGFAHPYPNKLLVFGEHLIFKDRSSPLSYGGEPELQRRILKRAGATHVVGHGIIPAKLGNVIGRWRDDALSRMVYRPPGEPLVDSWAIVELPEPFPEARAVARARNIPDRTEIVRLVMETDDPTVTYFLSADGVPSRPVARMARVKSWNGSVAIVEHDGPCDLVLSRTYYPGWVARIDDGLEQPVLMADVGFQAVRIDGAGTHRVELRYHPTRLPLLAGVSVAASLSALWSLAVPILAAWRTRLRRDHGPAVVRG
jgi:hypothetical protein